MLPEGRRPIATFADTDESTSPALSPANADPPVSGVKTNRLPGQALNQLSFPRRDVERVDLIVRGIVDGVGVFSAYKILELGMSMCIEWSGHL